MEAKRSGFGHFKLSIKVVDINFNLLVVVSNKGSLVRQPNPGVVLLNADVWLVAQSFL